MKAVVIRAPGRMELSEQPVPRLDNECCIRVRMAGICGTDLQLLEGYADFHGVPGHEFVGTVEDVSRSADARWIGRRVVGEINIGCGRCHWCSRGIREHCTQRTVLGIRGRDGAFAEFLSLPASNLHEVPDEVGDVTAVFVEPTAAACRILEQIPMDARPRTAVIGDGRLALLTAQVLRTSTPDVIMLGRHDRKLEIAESLGLRTARSDSSFEQRFDVVVDATGRPEGLRRALELVEPRGVIVMKSTFHGEAPLASWPIVVNEVTLVGSRCGPFRRAIEMLASGAVDVKPLISRIAALTDFESAFADARRLTKVILQPGADGAPR